MTTGYETREVTIDMASRSVMKLALAAHQGAKRDAALTVAHLGCALAMATRLSHMDPEQVIDMLRTLMPLAAEMMRANPEIFGPNTGRH